MTLPKAVVFDLGKVLVDFDYSIASRRIASRGKLLAAEIRAFIDQSPLLFKLETGLVTVQEFYEQVCASTGFCGDIEEFAGFFADIFTPIEPMVQLHADLKARRIPTYIFSNTNDLAVSHIRRNFPFFSNFEGYILSYQHGAMKPDPRLYEVVERESRLQKAELLYLDDRPENIEAGHARGWQTILHEDPVKTLELIRKLGLLEPSRADRS